MWGMVSRSHGSSCLWCNWYQGGCLCENRKPSFFALLIFNWCTFSRRIAARWLLQWAKNQVLTNQNSRNRWSQIVRRTICKTLPCFYLAPWLFDINKWLSHLLPCNLYLDQPICSQHTLFLSIENIRKPSGFLMFSGGRERVHWKQMS